MISSKKRGIIGLLCASITIGAISFPVIAETGTSPPDFTTGAYDTWDGISYTFDWYTAPETAEDGSAVYTISSASDFAALSVITNDLSGDEYSNITANIAAEDAQYIETVDLFDGDTIKLAANIDLANYDWLPIAYPWRTANLSSAYEFANTNGEIVTYNAVDHIPDDVVDVWVGDVNGEPISTRYWEYPESELRFRDYIDAKTFSSTHELSDFEWDVVEGTKYWYPGPSGSATLQYWGMPLIGAAFSTTENVEDETGFGYDPSTPAASIDPTYGPDKLSAKTIIPVDYTKEIATPYSFKPIAGYTEFAGFSGTFDGDNFHIKGVSPDTPWTEDETERLTTYDPIGRGLFSLVSEQGAIKNLNVQGEYDDEICSYSAILCAYNFGSIENCKVDGTMSQSLITMVYPIAKDYAPDGNSEYLLSDTAGTILPVGNSGFVTSQNYGTIENCQTTGNVTQAFRQFGFIASTNNGVINSCTNAAELSTTPVTTDFFTYEWSHSDENNSAADDKYIFSINTGNTPVYPEISVGATMLPPALSHMNKALYDVHDAANYGITHTALVAMSLSAAVRSNSILNTNVWSAGATAYASLYPALNDELWIAPLYNVEDEESIAANILYGRYIMTLAAGIAAVNNGEINNCANFGAISAIENVTEEQLYTRKNHEDVTIDDTDAYSWIRPQNQYGLFATATSSARLHAGISAVNTGAIANCSDAADLSYGETGVITTNGVEYDVVDDAEGIASEYSSLGNGNNTSSLNIIAATANGFYCNDVKYDSDYYAFGTRWWISEDMKNAALPDGYTSASYDANMPYPFYFGYNELHSRISGGISVHNCGTITDCSATGRAYAGLAAVCIGGEITNCSDVSASDTDIGYAIRYAENGTFSDLTCEDYCFGTITQSGDSICIGTHIVADSIAGTVNGEDTDKLTLETVYANSKIAYNIQTATVNDFVTCGSIASSTRGSLGDWEDRADLNNCKISNGVVLGENLCNLGILNSELTDITVLSDTTFSLYVPTAGFGSVDSAFNNITISTLTSPAPTLNENYCTILGNFDNCELDNIRVHGNNIAFWMTDCVVNDMITSGETGMDFVDWLRENIIRNGSAQEYLYFFENCECTDMFLESDIQFEFANPLTSSEIQKIPGVLKAIRDTNTFTRCVVSTPDGAISYPTTNVTSFDDATILTDAKLIYSDGSWKNGALAYYLDKGYSDNRTFDFTVAENDTFNCGDMISGDLAFMLEDDVYAEVHTDVTIPAYTRAKTDASEPSFYAISAPYSGAGAGEIKLSVTRGDDTWSTSAAGNAFPETDIFVIPDETFTYEVNVADGAGLTGITWSTKTDSYDLTSEGTAFENFKITSSVAPAEDVVILGRWANVWDIKISDAHTDWLLLETSAAAALPGAHVMVNANVLGTDNALGAVYYYPYALDANNDWVLDMSEKTYVDLSTGVFEMPNAHIMLFAEALNTGAEITEFVIGGKKGTIDNDTITIGLDATLDITSLIPDSIVISPNATITPAPNMPQDFSEPVQYTVTSESGAVKTYSVQVIPTEDGLITQFELAGRLGVIDQTAKTITVTVPPSVDLWNTQANIVWSGTAITPDPSKVKDYHRNDVTYTVTASDGTLNPYTIIIDVVEASSWIDAFVLETDNKQLTIDIDEANSKIYVYYDYGTDVSNVKLTSYHHMGATSNLALGDTLNLTQHSVLSLTTDYGDTKFYDLLAIERPNPDKMITQFILFGHIGTIDQETGEIRITLPSKYDITRIQPDAIAYRGHEILGVNEFKDFSQPVEYTVTSFDGTSKTYTIIVTRS